LVVTTKRKTKRFGLLCLCFGFFLSALLAKEEAINFALIIPLALFLFSNNAGSKRRNKDVLLTFSPILMAVITFFLLRAMVISDGTGNLAHLDLLNDPFVQASAGEKYATIMYTLGLYIKLLVFPSQLTHDYYPYHIPLVSIFDLRAIIPFFVYLMLLVYISLYHKTRKVEIFGILVYLLPLLLVSNIFFNIGTFMAERFIYVPSLGFCLLSGHLCSKLMNKKHRKVPHFPAVCFLLVIIVFTWQTINRNWAWADNEILYATDVKTSANSAKVNLLYGELLFRKARLEVDPDQKKLGYDQARIHLEKVIQIHPSCVLALMYLGTITMDREENCRKAFNYFVKAYQALPSYYIALHSMQTLATNCEDQTVRKEITTFLAETEMKDHP